ncbi:MAG: aminotransferase class V-fold PLP-dependent enzyme [Deltaproteobacteria bacterium]|nr:aminotransferase class V-fold PLP-dependent enzyme [Deltaproteobacteria bacterium]
MKNATCVKEFHNFENLGSCEFDQLSEHISKYLAMNKIGLCLAGEGYYPFSIKPVVEALILKNPAWYSPYTPYQAEISQGRLELLWLFQEFFRFYTQHDVSVASMLDVGSAVCDAIRAVHNATKTKSSKFLLVNKPFSSVLSVIGNRLHTFEIEDDLNKANECFCYVVSLPDLTGNWIDDDELFLSLSRQGLKGIGIIDPFFLIYNASRIRKIGLDIIVGSTQRLGCPMWIGGPYPAFFTAKGELLRFVPGRIVTKTLDAKGKSGFKLALQTREQHIRKEKATSNICTSQTLAAILVIANLMLEGKKGLGLRIAKTINHARNFFNACHYPILTSKVFDTVTINLRSELKERLLQEDVYFFDLGPEKIRLSFNEFLTEEEVNRLYSCLNIPRKIDNSLAEINIDWPDLIPSFDNELEFERYLNRLAKKDYSHLDGMIPLGSCTMKLNRAETLIFFNHRQTSNIHPFQPKHTLCGFKRLLEELKDMMRILTGFELISFHPNSGAQAELCALLTVRKYFYSRNEKRDTVLIPESAHGTNPASAIMAGFNVVYVKASQNGGIDLEDLRKKLGVHVACVMITYPSTYGVFDPRIVEVNEAIHQFGAFSYLDGANFNAFVGWLKPRELGFDMCHLNMHKTFGIPHGGGGPGAGCFCASNDFSEFFPLDWFDSDNLDRTLYTNSSPWGNAGALIISYMYIKRLGTDGLKKVSSKAIFNANFLKNLLKDDFKVFAENENGFVAHEFILGIPELEKIGYTIIDFAKRIIDYGFHPPTVHWPVANSLMIEPTETEPLEELENFAQALISIKKEMREFEGKIYNPVKNSPHAIYELVEGWNYEYEPQIAFPNLLKSRFASPIKRLDEAKGDRDLICSCLGTG